MSRNAAQPTDLDAKPELNQPLLAAALAGLLCVAVSGCTIHTSSSASKADTSASDGDAGTVPEITSSQVVAALDKDGFTQLCDARGGVVEDIVECGGRATAKGFSYDLDTSTLSEHTCAGANTCAGWNCIIE